MDRPDSQNVDREIVQGLREGSQYALTRLERRYRDRLYEYARSQLRDKDTAATVACDTLLQVIKSIDDFKFRSSDDDFRNWVYQICRRKVIDVARQMSREGDQATIVSLDMGDEEGDGYGYNSVRIEVDKQIAEQYYSEPIDESNELREAATEFIQGLGVDDRIILTSCLREMPHSEVAEYIGLTPNNVKVRFHRIKKRFVVSLKQRGFLC